MIYFSDDEDDWRYVSALPSQHTQEKKYFSVIGKSFVDIENPDDPLPFRILDVCTCSKNDLLFFQYRAEASSSSTDDDDCHFTPCEEIFNSPEFKFLPGALNTVMKKTDFFNKFSLIFRLVQSVLTQSQEISSTMETTPPFKAEGEN